MEVEGRIVEACRSACRSIVEAFKVSADFEREKAQAVDRFKASKEFHEPWSHLVRSPLMWDMRLDSKIAVIMLPSDFSKLTSPF